jgi:hypothetical protein
MGAGGWANNGARTVEEARRFPFLEGGLYNSIIRGVHRERL